MSFLLSRFSLLVYRLQFTAIFCLCSFMTSSKQQNDVRQQLSARCQNYPFSSRIIKRIGGPRLSIALCMFVYSIRLVLLSFSSNNMVYTGASVTARYQHIVIMDGYGGTSVEDISKRRDKHCNQNIDKCSLDQMKYNWKCFGWLLVLQIQWFSLVS